tara:strand:+ start:1786 stop:2199 length:414 start_codon:yes stop_codon:yes gene_type:complete
MISTNLYEKKRRDNIAEERIKNGKKAMMFASFFLFTSASGLNPSSVLINYKDGGVGEATLINQNDGFATGEIKNISNTGGFVILKFNLKQSGNITTQDEIKLLDNEIFDLGQFQGKIYEISIENTSTQPVLINVDAM